MIQLKKITFNFEINELAWSANNDYILISTGSDEGNITIVKFENETFEFITTIKAHTSGSMQLKVDAGYSKIALGSYDQSVSIQ